MKEIYPSEHHRHSSVPFGIHTSSRSQEYPQYIGQGKANLRDSLSSGRSEGYNSAFDRASPNSQKRDVRGKKKARKYQVKEYEPHERRDYDDELRKFRGRSWINDKEIYQHTRHSKYRNDEEDERDLDYEYRGSWYHFPKRDEYDETEKPKKHREHRDRRDHRSGSRVNVYRYAESRDVTSKNTRSATYQNSGRYSGSGGFPSYTGQDDQNGSSAYKYGKYPYSTSQSTAYSQYPQNYIKSYHEPQYGRGSSQPTSRGTREFEKYQRILEEEEPTSPHYRSSRADHRAQRSRSRSEKPYNYSNMGECSVIANAFKQPANTYEEAMRELRVENSDDESCYVSQTRYKECPDHVYMCRANILPDPYNRYPDLTNAHVLYGNWGQIPEDPHCINVGPCEEQFGVCPIVTRVKKHSRMLSHEELSPYQFRNREGVIDVPPITKDENMTDKEFKNREDAKRRRYYVALQKGDIVFAAHCGHRRGKCQYPDDSQGYAPETYGYDSQARNGTCDYVDNNHPEEFINPDYPSCVVKQCTFEYKSPQYYGIPKARVNEEKQSSFYLDQKTIGRGESNKTGTCVCGNEKATGKRKHRCGFPTLHAEKNAKHPGEPFPHPRIWDNHPKDRLPSEYRRSSLKSRESINGSTSKSDRGSYQPSGSGSMFKAERGSYQRSSSVSKIERDSYQRPSSLPFNMTMPRPLSLCADATCISSGICGMSSSGGRYSGLDGNMFDGRSCSVSYASCKDLKRRLSPQTTNICCLPPLFADSIPRYPLPDQSGKDIASGIVDSIVNKATGGKDDGYSGGKRKSSSLRTSSISYKRTSTPFQEMSSAWLSPWCHDTYTGWDPSYGCTAADDSCKYQSNLPYPRTSAVDRWPSYYGYLWKDMETPIPRFRSKSCGRTFQKDYLTSNYNTSYNCPIW